MALAELPSHSTPGALLDSILDTFQRHHPDDDPDLIRRAYRRAEALHEGQFRQSGEPYIVHPLIVTEILAGYGMDRATLVAALLHDTVEDTDITIEDVSGEFGEEVAQLIDGVTKLDRIKFSSREEAQAATIRKMAIAMARDIRVLLIKLADRLHNIRTLAPLAEEKRHRVAEETLEVYAPLAHRLGVQEIKHEMEELCFAELYPKRKAELEEQVNRRAPEREKHLERVMVQLAAALDKEGVDAEVSGRPKHLYSIYRKMVASGLAFDQIHDLIGIRVLVSEVKDCYAVLGLVHTMWPPIQGRFKDYIAMPKFNLYQSLHTTVVGPDGKGLEVQIRTHEMHHRAEYGIAAHWRYKEDASPDELGIVADLRFLQEEATDPQEFLNHLKLDLYQDEVFALTPKGDVLSLPRGSTPVDFAYRIHTEVGHRCVGARVNGRLVPLQTPLESGDIVEIITSRSEAASPSRDWLEFVKSSRAAAKIRRFFTQERREVALADGRDAVMKAMRREGFGVKDHLREGLLSEVARDLGHDDLPALYVAVGDGRVSPQNVMRRIGRILNPEEDEAPDTPEQARPRRARDEEGAGVIVEGMEDLLVRMARCCTPIPGDDIIGFVTVGRGVSVHRADCANIGALGERAERMIDVSWASRQVKSFFVSLQVEALDRSNLLRDVTVVLSDLGANIIASSSATGSDRVAVLRFEVELSDPSQVERAIRDLRGVDGVFDAYRLGPRAKPGAA